MERQSRLADLKLVNKYYPPVGIANYSYPSPKLDSMSLCDRPVGRFSVGSEASVPNMVDDRESIISTDEDDKSFYHVSGAEAWDKFWEDPFWEANAEEAEQEADGIAQRILSRNASYPALIPSPDGSHPKNQYFHRTDAPGFIETVPPLTWRLAAAEGPVPARPATPKICYSLFPRQTPTPPAVVNLSPRRPSIAPRSTSLWSNRAYNDSSTSLNSLGRSSMVRKAHSDVPLAQGRSSWTTPSNNAPVLSIPSPSAFDIPARRDSSQSSINFRQRFPVRPARTRSDTLASQCSLTSGPRSSSFDICTKRATSNPSPTTLCPAPPPCAPHRLGERHSQPEARKLPPPLQLHRYTPEASLPSPPPSSTPASAGAQRQSPALSHVFTQPSPCTPSTAPSPRPVEPPMPVSFFDVDSDSEEEEEGTSFARYIARSFTSHVRARSANAAPRSRKGLEVAKLQLRRVRAETTVGSPTEEEGGASAALGGGLKRGEHRAPLLRKQKSEVFGRIFWNRR